MSNYVPNLEPLTTPYQLLRYGLKVPVFEVEQNHHHQQQQQQQQQPQGDQSQPEKISPLGDEKDLPFTNRSLRSTKQAAVNQSLMYGLLRNKNTHKAQSDAHQQRRNRLQKFIENPCPTIAEGKEMQHLLLQRKVLNDLADRLRDLANLSHPTKGTCEGGDKTIEDWDEVEWSDIEFWIDESDPDVDDSLCQETAGFCYILDSMTKPLESGLTALDWYKEAFRQDGEEEGPVWWQSLIYFISAMIDTDVDSVEIPEMWSSMERGWSDALKEIKKEYEQGIRHL
ncbi:hypothetical protein QBC35DRAFT_477103 [Podospora australis]|uniref:Uncharacterized protein n=1 Tax=Podospora australis TaxID=1536484 RepID=A0AAN6WMF3_9PEZI|nr:hypothetical protein QBC35DRAFT_477103 [Podospora australis]